VSSEFKIESISLAQVTARRDDDRTNPIRPVVLVVDDEHIIADTLGSILELSGYAPMVAYDAVGALDLARVIPPDLLISDVMMPGMSGVELAMTIARVVQDCKILLFSGQAATLDLLSAARSAGFDFPALTKPVHPTVMLAQVSELFPRYTAHHPS